MIDRGEDTDRELRQRTEHVNAGRDDAEYREIALRRNPNSPLQRTRLLGYTGTTAVASISTRAAFSTSRTTCTSAIAG